MSLKLSSLNKGLVLHLPLDRKNMMSAQVAGDRTPYCNHGTCANIPNFVEGPRGGAMSFNGTSDRVNCGNDASLDILDKITISAWFKTTRLLNQVLIGKNHSLSYYVNISSGNLTFYTHAQGIYTTGVGLSNGEWHHFVGTLSAISKNIDIDGIHRVAGVGTLAADTTPLRIGCNNLSQYYFDGSIADVRIYNRALSESEIAQLFELDRKIYIG